MNRRIEKLLNSLREAIHEALGESPSVAAVMAELEREGHSPSFLVDVGLPYPGWGSEEGCSLEEALTSRESAERLAEEEREPVMLEVIKRDGPLYLTESDQVFLKNLGVIPFA